MRLTQQRGAKMLKSETGATMEVDIEETPSGWVARYLIVSEDREKAKPQRQLFASKADAVAWLSAEARRRRVGRSCRA